MRPKAYDPQDGYRYQIFCRSQSREWEHCDYATDRHDRKHLLDNYRQAYVSPDRRHLYDRDISGMYRLKLQST